MINVWNSMDIQIKVALIGAAGVIIAAIVAGVFSLVKKDSNSNNRNGETITIPPPKATVEKQKYNAKEYMHNSFIPSLDDLEKESSDNAFAEGLATFLGADRSDEDITITRKGK